MVSIEEVDVTPNFIALRTTATAGIGVYETEGYFLRELFGERPSGSSCYNLQFSATHELIDKPIMYQDCRGPQNLSMETRKSFGIYISSMDRTTTDFATKSGHFSCKNGAPQIIWMRLDHGKIFKKIHILRVDTF